MKLLTTITFVFTGIFIYAQQFTIQSFEMSPMPEAISNNAVCEGFIGNTPYVYSFCGIDTSKAYSGVHLKSYRYNTLTDTWESIADVPDTLGKIAAFASRVGNIIYVIGGYHILSNGNEISSKSVHRFDILNNVWLTDATPIPIAIDDQVQAVYNDSLIYVITGWSNSSNVTSVQIYNTYSDSWQTGTTVPNKSTSRLFGASGTIIGNKIYYFGGAKNGSFSANNVLNIGEINTSDPTQITWTDTIISSSIYGYRTVCSNIWNHAFWIGGSDITYNYNGIAYNGSGGVPPNNRIFSLNSYDMLYGTDSISLPMDLRGIANTSLFTKYIAGGMENNQQVSNKTIKLQFTDITGLSETKNQSKIVSVYPNPTNDKVIFESVNGNNFISIELYDITGRLKTRIPEGVSRIVINTSNYSQGIYFYYVKLSSNNSVSGKLIVK